MGVLKRVRPSSLRCDSVQIDEGLATIQVASTRCGCTCPCCGRESSRVHSCPPRAFSVSELALNAEGNECLTLNPSALRVIKN